MGNDPLHDDTGIRSLQIPKLIFGTSALGNLYQEIDVTVKRDIVAGWFEAMEPPVCIDSAGKYGAGLALEEIGSALQTLGVAPDTVIISNKLGWKRVPLAGKEPTFERGVWKNLRYDAVQSISYDGILACWKQGNALLGDTYAAQLLSVHDPDEYLAAAESPADRRRRLVDIQQAYQALEDLKKAGKVKAIGIGSKDWTVIRELAEDIRFDWIMLAGSLTIYTHPQELLQFIDELDADGVFVINSAVFNAGFLVGGSYFDYKSVNRDEDTELFRWRDRFTDVCRQFGVNAADACVEFGLSPKAVRSIAMNTTKPARIAENVTSIKKRAPDEFWNTLLRENLISITPEAMR